jgi:hypothetical protein
VQAILLPCGTQLEFVLRRSSSRKSIHVTRLLKALS